MYSNIFWNPRCPRILWAFLITIPAILSPLWMVSGSTKWGSLKLFNQRINLDWILKCENNSRFWSIFVQAECSEYLTWIFLRKSSDSIESWRFSFRVTRSESISSLLPRCSSGGSNREACKSLSSWKEFDANLISSSCKWCRRCISCASLACKRGLPPIYQFRYLQRQSCHSADLNLMKNCRSGWEHQPLYSYILSCI